MCPCMHRAYTVDADLVFALGYIRNSFNASCVEYQANEKHLGADQSNADDTRLGAYRIAVVLKRLSRLTCNKCRLLTTR